MQTPEHTLESIVHFLDEFLRIRDFPDFDGAQNGLQVEATPRVRRIGAAVDASIEVIHRAAEGGVDLLLVHHGLYWDGLRPLTGRSFRRVAPLIQRGVALYAAHLPLDAHPEIGNATLLARALGWTPAGPFGAFRGVHLGVRTEVELRRDALVRQISGLVGAPVHLIPGGPEGIRRVGVVTGAGAGMIREAASEGLDTLITGEGPHHSHADAMEFGLNVVYAGHYATETWGVQALARLTGERFGLPWEFLDAPSGL